MSETPDEFIPTRDSLLGRLNNWDDQDSWREFYDTYWRLIYGVALKSGLTEVVANDVVQETVICLARKMKEFKYDPAIGSFKGWLLTQTRWQVANQFRRRKHREIHQADETGKTRLIDKIPDPAVEEVAAGIWDEEWEKNQLTVATERVKETVSPQQFQIFQLYVLKNWPVRKVAETLGVSTAQVYVTKHRITSLLKKEILKLNKTLF